MSNCWIRKDFYIAPPTKDATPAEWEQWLIADKKKAISEKRAFTRRQAHETPPESMNGSTMRRVNGVWRATTNIGFTGDAESGRLEPIIQPSQERDLACSRIIPLPRGVSHKRSGNQNRKVRKTALKAANAHFAQLRRQGKLS